MSIERQQLEATISALDAQRAVLGATLVDAALRPLHARLAALATAQCDPVGVGVAQTLKQVSVLFLDVVGSTPLSQYLDPEDVHTIMDGALASCTGIVQAHRGKVLKYAGDSLLAVFGADEVREDDPERAVLAGLALLAEGQRQGEIVLQRYGHAGFNVRIGVHTGAVLLGGGVDAEGSIRGFTVNVAARMEQTAPAGALRISHDTYRHVRGVFDVVPQPPISVKGVDVPMVTYLVQRRKPRAFRVTSRGIEGIETRMVGRDTELEQLQDAFKRLYIQGTLSVVTVVAEAGIGKSRLLYEFENWAEARPEGFYFFQGRAQPLTLSQPYGLLRDILAWRLQIADSDSMETAKQKVEQGIAPLFLADDGADMAQAHAHLLGHLIGLDFADSKHIKGIQQDGKQIRSRSFHAAAQMFRRAAAQAGAPLLLLLDDLQYADDGSLDFLNYLCQVNRDVPMLILTLTRPTLREWPVDWPHSADTLRIVLNPLDKNSSRLLVSELLKKLPEVPAALRELITGGAEGNPFYMEELVKMLIDEGAIVASTEQWHVNPERLLATHVPQTLTGVLQARLDGMKPADKLALQQASVIGFVFWDQALAALDPKAPDALPSLVRHELTVARQDAALDGGVEGVREYAFAHQILHQVTYDTLLKRTRREHHAQAAKWLSSLSGARAKDFLGAAAEHFVKAGDHAQGCEFFTRAAEHAAGRYAHEAAMSYVAKALALTDSQTNPKSEPNDVQRDQQLLRWRLFDVRERTLDLQGRRTEQQADIDALQALADALDDNRRRCDVAWRCSTMAMRTGDYHTMENSARQAMTLAQHAGDAVLGLHGQHRLALALTYLGNAADGNALAHEGLCRARTLGARQLEALFLNALSVIADSRVDRLPSLDMDEQDLLLNRELGNRRHEAIALGNLGSGWLRLGEHTQARHYLEESLRLARAVGDRATQPDALTNLSVLALRQGDEALALTHAQAALDIASAVQSPEFEATALCALGNAELALGHFAPATVIFERAYAVALALDNAAQFDARAGQARVALAQGDTVGAMQAVESLLSQLAGGGTLEGTKAPYLIRLTCHQVLARVGDPRATALLASAHAELMALAATLTDAAPRHNFMNNIPEHSAIVASFSVAQTANTCS
jgi:class 3 adenylate cyclase/tetratricopeptide (TPR) repeat protein